MNKIGWTLATFLLSLTALWLLADDPWPAGGVFALRTAWMQYSGVLAIGAMSLAMVLANRPAWLERRLDGLDKTYRLHKWLGITALVVAIAHWLWKEAPKWAVGWGWLVRPPRGPRPEPGSIVEASLRQWRGLAEDVGEWAFYAIVVLLVLALVKRFPYRWFAKTHQLMAVAYLVLAFHALVLAKFEYWMQPLGWVLALMLVAGTVSALRVLSGRVGAKRTAHGVIESLQQYPALGVLETTLLMDPDWRGHLPGQFAFAMSDPREGAHPYTLASDWDAGQRRITFITKALGDHTRRLPQRLRVGDPVQVEGPYGCFTFDDHCPRQIWIGAGIGITPFIARMKYLARQRGADPRPVDLFHCTHELDPVAIARLRADAQAAGVDMHLFVGSQGERLDGERLRALVPGWREAGVWFCGPVAFGRSLRADLLRHGLPATAFHQELFEMR